MQFCDERYKIIFSSLQRVVPPGGGGSGFSGPRRFQGRPQKLGPEKAGSNRGHADSGERPRGTMLALSPPSSSLLKEPGPRAQAEGAVEPWQWGDRGLRGCGTRLRSFSELGNLGLSGCAVSWGAEELRS